MMLRSFFVFLFALVSTYANADYTQMQWGQDKTVSPYNFGTNITGTWNTLGTVSSAGVWSLAPSALTVKGNAVVSIFDYATCNGTADDSAGFVAAAASNKIISIPSNALCRIATNTTINPGSKWYAEKGGRITMVSGITLTFRTVFEAGRYQVFYNAGALGASPIAGNGAVLGIANTKPDWWGTDNTYGGVFDSQPAFQAAVNSALQATGSPLSDINGPPSVDIGQGFYNLCKPVDIYPDSARPLEIRGIGPWNSGSWVQTCSTFTGYAPFLVHGYTVASGNVYAVTFKDMSINNPVRLSGATAGIRYVPEGTGYNLNSLNKAALIENVKVADFPINVEVSNLQNLVIRRLSSVYSAANTTNNTGLRFYASGAAASGNAVGQVSIEDSLIDACPLANAVGCTNTTGVEIYSAAGANANSIVFRTTIFYSSNTFLKMTSTGSGSWLGDIWMAGDGNQFDGYGCKFIDASAASGGALFNVHIDGVYHTGASANTCVAHSWNNDGASTLNHIWDTNNHFVMGASSTAILAVFGSDMVISNNIIEGINATTDAIMVNLSNNTTVTGNVIKGTWRAGISLDSGTTNTIVSSNECNGATLSQSCTVDVTSLATTTNDVFGNSDRRAGPFLLTLKTYTIAGLPTCNAASLNTVATVSNGTAYGTGTYGSAVSATGIVTRQVLCTNTAGATSYAWAYN